MIGRFLPSFQKKPKRRVVQSPRFYYFLVAHSHYSGKEYAISYWQTTSQLEVDFILGDPAVAVGAKAVPEVSSRHLKGLQAFGEEYSVKKRIVVSLDKDPRTMGGIEILPWKGFLARLWGGGII